MPKRTNLPLAGPRLVVEEVIRNKGATSASVSLAIGRNKTYLQQWLRYGMPRELPEKTRKALAQELKVDEKELREKSTDKLLDLVGARQVETTNDDLPVYAAVEGGEGEMVVTSKAIRYIGRPESVRHVDTAYAIVVTGDLMVPVHEPGEIVIINPKLPPVPGKDAVFVSGVHGGDFKAALKRLVRSTPTHWIVRQFNPAKELQLPKNEWKNGFKVIGKELP